MSVVLKGTLLAIAFALHAPFPALAQQQPTLEETTAPRTVAPVPEVAADEASAEPTDEALDEAVDEAAYEAAPDPDAAAEEVSAGMAGLADPDIPREELELRLIPLTAADHEELAEAWLSIVRAKTEAVVEQALIVRGEDDDAARAARERIAELIDERRHLFDKFSVVLDSWMTKGGDADVVMRYRAYRAAIIIEETRHAELRTLLSQAQAWMRSPDGGVRLAINIGIVFAALAGLLLAARINRGLAQRSLARIPNLSRLMQAFLGLVVYWLTIAFGLMIVLSALEVNITPLFALVGGASFIIAFAMQDTLSNLAAGLMILINRPFDEGDAVDIGGVQGTVRSVSVVSTMVTTPDNEVIVVPNSKVWGNVIRNSSMSNTRRVDLTFAVARKESVEKVQRLLEDIVKDHPLILAAPEPTIRVSELTDAALKFLVQPWARAGDIGTVQADLLRRVKERMEREGVEAA